MNTRENRAERPTILRRFLNMRENGILLPLIGLSIAIGIFNPVFFKFENLMHILKTASFLFIPGIAITYVLISAGLDLSIGSVLALGGIMTGIPLLAGVPIALSIIIGIGAGAGFVNGFVITRFNIPPLITTLGMMYPARGIVEVLTRGQPVYPLPERFNVMGQPQTYGIEELGEQFAGKIAFLATSDIQKILTSGDKEKISDEVERVVKNWSIPDGGIVVFNYGMGEAIGVSEDITKFMFDEFNKYTNYWQNV